MKAKLAEIDKHSKMCFHGKVIPMNYNGHSCCCGHIKSCVGECQPVRQCCKPPNSTANPSYFENTRSMVETSHKQLRQSVCIKSRAHQPNQYSKRFIEKENETNSDVLYDEAGLAQENLKNIQNTNRELKRQVKELIQQKLNLKQKLDHTEKQLNILLSNTTKNEKIDHSKIQELILYIESQRDIYRNSVEQLLKKLDPSRSSNIVHEIESKIGKCSADNQFHVNKQSNNVILKNKPNHSRNYPSNKSYCQSIEKSSTDSANEITSPLEEKCPNKDSEVIQLSSKARPLLENKENEVDQKTKENVDSILDEILRGNSCSTQITKKELEQANARIADLESEIRHLTARLSEAERDLQQKELVSQDFQKQSSTDENSELRKEIVSLQQQLEECKLRDSLQFQRNNQYISEIRESTDNTIEGLQRDLQTFQKEVKQLRTQIEIKESHLHGMSREKDALQNHLDEKTTQLEDLKSKYRREKSQLVSIS